MFGKIIAGILMGIVVAILASAIFGIGSGGGEGGGRIGLWAAGGGFLLMLVLALRAERTRYAWGRGLLLNGLLCFAMPIAAIVFTGIVGAGAMSNSVGDASRAGTAIGTAIGGGIVTFVSGVIGFFLGLIFLIGSYFTLRRA
jgi:hypothetical protein